MFRRNERPSDDALPVRLNFVIRYQRFLKSRQMKEFLISQILLLFFKTDERCSSSAHRSVLLVRDETRSEIISVVFVNSL